MKISLKINDRGWGEADPGGRGALGDAFLSFLDETRRHVLEGHQVIARQKCSRSLESSQRRTVGCGSLGKRSR